MLERQCRESGAGRAQQVRQYLRSRKIDVSDVSCSGWQAVTSGVPQGSVLGPQSYVAVDPNWNTSISAGWEATCEHKGVRLETGDTWINEECYQCICLKPFGVGCCDSVPQPVDYPAWCELIQRPSSCLLAVVMKANHKIPCISKTTMGRLQLQNSYKEEENPFF